MDQILPRDVREVDRAWLEHVRWATDHLQQRLDGAAQAAWGLAGLAGVFVALIAPTVLRDLVGWAVWLGLTAMAALTCAVVILLLGVLPRSIEGINVVNYREVWRSYLQPTDGAPYSSSDVARIEALLVEEQLQSRGDPSPLIAMVKLLRKRHRALRLAIATTAGGAALIVTAVFASVISS